MIFSKKYSILLFVLFLFGGLKLEAQQLNIPRSSPKASVSQFIGVCNMSIAYARPSAKGRKIFGDLIPYEKVWRAGANEATVLDFDKEVSFEGHAIKAGKYGLFVIPGKQKWTIILNKEWEQWGAYDYYKDHDIIRFDVEPIVSNFTEMFSISFEEVNKESAVLQLKWENITIPIKLTTDTHKQTEKEIQMTEESISSNWYSFSAAAQYYFYERKEAEKALEYIDMAIILKAPNPAPWMLKSQIKASQNKYEEAIELAKKAIEVSEKHNFHYEFKENEENIEKWKSMMD